MWQTIVPLAMSLMSSASKQGGSSDKTAAQPTMPTAATMTSDEAKRQWFTPLSSIETPSVAPLSVVTPQGQTAGIAGGIMNAEAEAPKTLAAPKKPIKDADAQASLSALADAQQKRDAAMTSLIAGSPTVGSLSMPAAATVGGGRTTNSFY